MTTSNHMRTGPLMLMTIKDQYFTEAFDMAQLAVMMKEPTTVVLSGGMDSTVLLYLAFNISPSVTAVSFNYGQRHKRELIAAAETCHLLKIPHTVVDLQSLGATLKSSLLGSSEVPEGLYDEDNMKDTIVPNRNLIMLASAAGVAMSQGCRVIATAVHAGDHAVYPDCRPEFIEAAENAIAIGTESVKHIAAPFVHLTKSDIVSIGDFLGVVWSHTWSCYKGGEKHCGRCGTCTERIEAFYNAGVNDGVQYDSEGYRWAFNLLRAAGKVEVNAAD